jgi:hypothetical protein
MRRGYATVLILAGRSGVIALWHLSHMRYNLELQRGGPCSREGRNYA